MALLGIGPNITITGKVIPQMRERLPCQHDSAIAGTIQKGPMHRLRLANPGRARQVLDGGLRGHHMHIGVAIPRDQVHMGELYLLRQGELSRSGQIILRGSKNSIGGGVVVPAAPGYGMPGHPSWPDPYRGVAINAIESRKGVSMDYLGSMGSVRYLMEWRARVGVGQGGWELLANATREIFDAVRVTTATMCARHLRQNLYTSLQQVRLHRL